MTALYLEKEKKTALDAGFAAQFGGAPERYFSAPGRTEIGGNHTDHQRGRVLAAAVNLDTVAAVRVNGSNLIRIQSKGYPMCEVDIRELTPVEAEINSTPALIRGVAARFAQLGCKVEGFDAYVESTVLPGSGLSSSAAYEVLIGTIINHLFFDGKVSQPEIAMIGQYAENVFFGKPCGLMDQMASAVGNLVNIDFFHKENPVIHPVTFDFASCGHALCIIDSGADHADLTDEYAAVPGEIKAVAAYFGKEVLTQIAEADFYAAIPQLRKSCGDRAVMRCIHFYQENERVPKQVAALENGDFDTIQLSHGGLDFAVTGDDLFIMIPVMGKGAIRAILIALLIIAAIAAAFFPQHIQRAKAEKAVERLLRNAFVAGKIFAGSILKKPMMLLFSHNSFTP